jgi:hypothetical protein
MSCSSLYGLLTQLIISLFSNMTKVFLHTTIQQSFLLWFSLLYRVYMVLVVATIGVKKET